jgi:hypothetical protein
MELHPTPEHRCSKNHDGMSAAMEPVACLEMVIELYNWQQVVAADICLDDDASTCALLKCSNADWLSEEQQYYCCSDRHDLQREEQRKATDASRQRETTCTHPRALLLP